MLQSFKMALKSIWGNKLRSFLTMLGIIIGVASVIILVSIVNGYMSYMWRAFLPWVSIRSRSSTRRWHPEVLM